MIELRNIWYQYPGSKNWVLRDVSLVFKRGEKYLLIGPNAIGKTTLLKIAGLLYKPVKGSVLINGVDYWRTNAGRREELRKKIVYVHEKPILLRKSTLYNIAYGLIVRGAGREEALEKAYRFLERLGYRYLADKKPSQLSAGEAQLVSLLRAFLVDADYYLLDEPLSHIDMRRRRKLVEYISSEMRDKGLVIATHDPSLIYELKPRVILFEEELTTYESIEEFRKALWKT